MPPHAPVLDWLEFLFPKVKIWSFRTASLQLYFIIYLYSFILGTLFAIDYQRINFKIREKIISMCEKIITFG